MRASAHFYDSITANGLKQDKEASGTPRTLTETVLWGNSVTSECVNKRNWGISLKIPEPLHTLARCMINAFRQLFQKCVFVCVCVCVWEREREREEVGVAAQHFWNTTCEDSIFFISAIDSPKLVFSPFSNAHTHRHTHTQTHTHTHALTLN